MHVWRIGTQCEITRIVGSKGEMMKHYISFIAYVTTDRVQLVKLYPEGNAQTRVQLRGMGRLYIYCNKHGLLQKRIP